MEARILNYNINIIPKQENIPTFWYAGMSTELTTYPDYSTFDKRDFLWRLGFARIDIPKSNFSLLPGVHRHLMVTNDKLDIEHVNQYKKTLSELEVDTFSGDFETKTFGICSVFNLMTRENYKGSLFPLIIKPNCNYKLSYSVSYNEEIVSVCLYPISGSFKTQINNHKFEISTEDLLRIDCIESNSSVKFTLTSTSYELCKLAVSIIYK